MPKRITFKQARSVILDDLQRKGWTVKTLHNCSPMKVPHATSPNGTIRLHLKAQAIYIARSSRGTATHLTLKHAGSWSSDMRPHAERILASRAAAS